MICDKGMSFSHNIATFKALTKQKNAWKTPNELISYECGGKAQFNDFGRLISNMIFFIEILV